jgi:hypothetical protein
MSEAKHTPGPWVRELALENSNRAVISAFSSGGNRVMKITVDTFNPEGDGCLVVAAPDLLKELDIRASDLVMLRKAIHAGDPKAELLTRVNDMLRETRAAIAKAEPRT